jgi:hypothetical protein
MDLKSAWYDAIETRSSRRRYAHREIPADVRERLEAFCAEVGRVGDARVCLIEDAGQTLFTGAFGAYGGVAGTPFAAAIVGREGAEADVGYLGEAFILEATTLGLGTCWIAASFDKERASQLLTLEPGELVMAVTPLGYPIEHHSGSERLMRTYMKASTRLSIDRLAPSFVEVHWPRWAVTAVEAAQRAPSGGNRQPWRFRMEGGALVMSRAAKLYRTAHIDFGIAMLHVELGAAHEGVSGSWQQLEDPDVARFTPGPGNDDAGGG